jgi:hypothetical protein
MDEINPDGRRIVGMKVKKITIENRKYAVNLLCYESNNNLEWRILVSSYDNIPSDNIVLLKLKNGQTISLTADTLYSGSYKTNPVVYNSPFVSSVQQGTTYTYYVFESCIKTEDLNSIEAYGITKIRIGNNANYFETIMNNNELGKHFTKCRKGITEYLHKTKGQKKGKGSVYDGF